MSVISSSSSNNSLPSFSLSSSLSMQAFLQSCFSSEVGTFDITIFIITSILIVFPLCALVLYLGLQRRRQQGSSTTMSHSDHLTYHMVIAELLSILGSALCRCSVLTDLPILMLLGIFLLTVNLSGQLFFHVLTCVERYLAVVHPITYLSLRNAKGIKIRNITIGCVWLLSFAVTGLFILEDIVATVVIAVSLSVFVLTVVTFCSLSVLCVLIRPGPREGGGGRQQVDQSKLRAFYTIMVILGVLLLRMGGNLLCCLLINLHHLEMTGRCSLWISILWFSLPSSLVLPLLFLQRAGKLLCCKSNNKAG